MNQVILTGNLGGEPSFFQQKDLAVLSLATNQYYKKPDSEEFTTATQWHSIFCNGYLAQKALDLKKGDKILVQGVLKYKPILDNYGNKTQSAYITAQKIEIFKPKVKLQSEQDCPTTEDYWSEYAQDINF